MQCGLASSLPCASTFASTQRQGMGKSSFIVDVKFVLYPGRCTVNNSNPTTSSQYCPACSGDEATDSVVVPADSERTSNKKYTCSQCNEVFWWPAKSYDAQIASHSRMCTVESASCDTGSFVTRKDQGWGRLLDSKRVKAGDTICPPCRGENKERRAVVRSDGKLLENGTDVWKDPVAFCVRNNDWRESSSFLRDRSRFLNCIRICKDTRDEDRLSDLKAGRRSRSSQGDQGPPSTNLKPVRGAVVKVRFEEDEEITWLQGKLTDLNKETGEWSIKLDSCDGAQESQGECNGCNECVWELAPDDRSW